MFFAESLGPAITSRTGAALFEHVRLKLGARSSASTDELRAIVTEFIRGRRLILTPDAAIQYLAMNGRLAQQDARTFRLAA
ncbi:hypothetical protein [Candidatus Viadribacter manganicus]|nr:hypothetical protein [Candidatus Viadribacter manganicus]